MSFILVIPFLVFLLIIRSYNRETSFLHAILGASALFAGGTIIGAELLSLFSQYNYIGVLLYWLVLTVVVTAVFRGEIREGIYSVRVLRLPKLSVGEWVCVCTIIAFISGALHGLLAFPPTSNYDSMSFHMPRVFFWMKNESVHNYATLDGRQLYSGPFSGFSILQLQVLNFGRDYFAGMVQWFAYIGAILAVASTARELGASRAACIASATLTATIPLAFMQARTTQNDLVTAFLCALVIYQVVWFIKNKPSGSVMWLWAVVTGFGGGAAALSKNSAYPVLAPFAVLLVIMTIKELGVKRLAAVSSIVLSLVLLMTIGFYTRNVIDLGGDPLGTNAPTLAHTSIRTRDIRYRTAALIYNTSKNFATNNAEMNHNINRAVNRAMIILGVDPLSDNPEYRIIEHNNPIHVDIPVIVEWLNNHDVAPAPLHSILVVISAIILLLLFLGKKLNDKLLILYTTACFFAYLIMGVTVIVSSSVPRYMMSILIPSLAFAVMPFQSGTFRKVFISISLCLITFYSTSILVPYTRGTQWRNSRSQLLLLENTEYEYYAIRDVILESGATKIGVNNRALAYYPWLYLWIGAEYDVRMIGTNVHIHDECKEFVPDALLIYIPTSTLQGIGVENYRYEYNGQTYGVVRYAPDIPFGVTHTLLFPVYS
jgi:hypothetical protein